MALLAKYSAPFKGINTSVPANKIDASEAVSMNFFTTYDGLLQPTQINTFGVTSADNTPIRAMFTFTDPTGLQQNGYITDLNIIQTTPGHMLIEPLPTPGLDGFTNLVVANNRVYFVNGTQFVMVWDGLAISQATNLYGGVYIFILASSLCIANTIEAGGEFNQRVRWTVAGNFTQWDPSVFIGAGFEDLLECPDGIHGVLNTNPVAYIPRSNGITQMVPTGVGTSAFNFPDLWNSANGIGNIVDLVAATFGPFGFVLSTDDIYIITNATYDRIGSKVKNSIYADLLIATMAYGWMEPLIAEGAPYLRYRLGINMTGRCVIWSFSTETYAWEREEYTDRLLTGPGSLFGAIPGYSVYQLPVIPYQDLGTGEYLFGVLLPPATGITQIPTYTFKVESDSQDRSISVTQVKIRYQYLGNTAGHGVPTTVTVAGMNGVAETTINLADPGQSKQYYGGAKPPKINGNFYNAYITVPLTDLEFQVTISLAPPADIKISDVCVFGTVGNEVVRG